MLRFKGIDTLLSERREGHIGAGKEETQFDHLQTSQLKEMLQMDAEEIGDPALTEGEIMKILEILVERAKSNGEYIREPEDAWKEFLDFYKPMEKVESDSNNMVAPATSGKMVLRSICKHMAAVAAIVMLIATGAATAGSINHPSGPWRELLRWTTDAFSFRWEENETTGDTEKPLFIIEEFCTVYGIPEDAIQIELPSKAEIVDVFIDDTPALSKVTLLLQSDHQRLRIQFVRRQGDVEQEYEAAGDIVDTMEKDGIWYFIMRNEKEYRISWLYDDLECSVSGEITLDEAYRFIGKKQEE